MTNPRIVIGAGRPNKLAALVCHYTIIRTCPRAEVTHTFDRPFLLEGAVNQHHRASWDNDDLWIPTGYPHGTMFSYCRWMTAEILGNVGEGIYLDSDMILMKNASIEEVHRHPMGDAAVLTVKGHHQTSVCKLDCEMLAAFPVRRLLMEFSYRDVIRGRHLPEGWVRGELPTEWNVLDRFHAGTKLIHYTRMPTQPWINPAKHRAGDIWFDTLAEAVQTGFLTMETVREEIREQNRGKEWQAALYPQPHVLECLEARL